MNTRKVIFAVLFVLLANIPAHAGMQTFSYETGYQETNNQTLLYLPQFDPSLGTLLSVDFTLQGLGEVMFNLTDLSKSTPLLYGISAGLSLALENPACSPYCSSGQDLIITLPSTFYPSTYVGTVGSEVTLAGGQSTGWQTLTPFTPVTDPGPFACSSYATLCSAVTGTGTILDVVDMIDETTLTASGGSKSFSEVSSGDGLITVTYSYNSLTTVDATVPEPASFGFFAFGLTGMALIYRMTVSRR